MKLIPIIIILIINCIIAAQVQTDLTKWDMFILLTLLEVAAWVLIRQQRKISHV